MFERNGQRLGSLIADAPKARKTVEKATDRAPETEPASVAKTGDTTPPATPATKPDSDTKK